MAGLVHVATAVDANQVWWLPTTINSADVNSSVDLVWHVLHRGLSADDLFRLRSYRWRHTQIEFHNMLWFLKGQEQRFVTGLWTVSAMDRLAMPEMLPDISKIVYLDIDLAVEGDLATLADWPAIDVPIIARPELAGTKWDTAADFIRMCGGDPSRMSGLFGTEASESHCFNSGVMIMDLDFLRRDPRWKLVGEVLTGDYGWMNDQPLLVMYCAGRQGELPPKWNLWANRGEIPDGMGILHWAGMVKPWDAVAPLAVRWWRYYRA